MQTSSPATISTLSGFLSQRRAVFAKTTLPQEGRRLATYFGFALVALALAGLPLFWLVGLLLVCPLLVVGVTGLLVASARSAGASASIDEQNWLQQAGIGLAAALLVSSVIDFLTAAQWIAAVAFLLLSRAAVLPLLLRPSPLPAAGVCLTPRLTPVPFFSLGH